MRISCIVKPHSVAIYYHDLESAGELLELLKKEDSALRQIWESFPDSPVNVSVDLDDIASVDAVKSAEAPAAPATNAKPAKPPGKKRGRPAKNPESATAPAPMPVAPPPAPPPVAVAPPAPPAPPPAAVAPPPAPVAPTESIPPFLQRSAPPPAPAAPRFEVGNKIKAYIVDQAGSDDHAQKEWARWLVGAGLVIEGATFREAVDCVALTPDEALKEAATELGLA